MVIIQCIDFHSIIHLRIFININQVSWFQKFKSVLIAKVLRGEFLNVWMRLVNCDLFHNNKSVEELSVIWKDYDVFCNLMIFLKSLLGKRQRYRWHLNFQVWTEMYFIVFPILFIGKFPSSYIEFTLICLNNSAQIQS